MNQLFTYYAYRNKIKLLIISILILFYSIAHSSTGINDQNCLEIKSWSILHDQNSSLEEIVTKTGWKSVSIPIMFKSPNKPEDIFQFSWLKGEFEINNEPSEYYGIVIENVFVSISIYINEQLIDQRLPKECTAVHNPVHFEIPMNLLKKGKNNIYIYLGNYGYDYSGIGDKVLLCKKKEYYAFITKNNFIYYQFPLGFIFFLLLQVFFNISLYIWDRKEKTNLISALICFVFAIIIFLYFIPNINVNYIIRSKILYLSVWLIPVLYVYLMQAFYNEFLYGFNIIFILIIGFILIVTGINIFLYYNFFLFSICITITVIGVTLILIYLLYRLNKIKPDPVLFYSLLIFCISIPLFLFLIDLINYFFISHIPPLRSVFFSPFFTLGLMILIIRKIKNRQENLKLIYDKLNISLESNKKSEISLATQKKLEIIIDFINENYKENLSREGLAATVDFSPDHLSRVFNTFTGKRLNYYINELRIKEAVSILLETNERITDIAFKVGFESIATFNRAFLEIMNTTPTEYRNINNKNDNQKS